MKPKAKAEDITLQLKDLWKSLDDYEAFSSTCDEIEIDFSEDARPYSDRKFWEEVVRRIAEPHIARYVAEKAGVYW